MARTEIIYVTAIKLLISWQIRIWQNIWSLKNVKSSDFAFPIKHDVANRGRLGQGASMVWVVGSESVLTRDKKGRDWKFEKSWVTIDSTPHCTGNGQCYVTSVGTNKKLIWKYVGCLFIVSRVSSDFILIDWISPCWPVTRVSVLSRHGGMAGLVYSTKIQGQRTSHPHYVCLKAETVFIFISSFGVIRA